MADIIHFPKEESESLVWQCGCGNASFWVHQDGTLQCVACHDIDHMMEIGIYRNFTPCND